MGYKEKGTLKNRSGGYLVSGLQFFSKTWYKFCPVVKKVLEMTIVQSLKVSNDLVKVNVNVSQVPWNHAVYNRELTQADVTALANP